MTLATVSAGLSSRGDQAVRVAPGERGRPGAAGRYQHRQRPGCAVKTAWPSRSRAAARRSSVFSPRRAGGPLRVPARRPAAPRSREDRRVAAVDGLAGAHAEHQAAAGERLRCHPPSARPGQAGSGTAGRSRRSRAARRVVRAATATRATTQTTPPRTCRRPTGGSDRSRARCRSRPSAATAWLTGLRADTLAAAQPGNLIGDPSRDNVRPVQETIVWPRGTTPHRFWPRGATPWDPRMRSAPARVDRRHTATYPASRPGSPGR